MLFQSQRLEFSTKHLISFFKVLSSGKYIRDYGNQPSTLGYTAIQTLSSRVQTSGACSAQKPPTWTYNFQYQLATSQYQMGSIVIIKPLSTVLSSAANKSQQSQRKILGNVENQTRGCWVRMLPLCYATPLLKKLFGYC